MSFLPTKSELYQALLEDSENVDMNIFNNKYIHFTIDDNFYNIICTINFWMIQPPTEFYPLLQKYIKSEYVIDLDFTINPEFDEIINKFYHSIINNKYDCLIHYAIDTDNIYLLKYLQEYNYINNNESNIIDIISNTVKNNHFEIFKYLVEVGYPGDELCAHAAMYGNIEYLIYARESECEWDSKTSMRAALNGHINILNYALKNNCPFFEDICAYAALSGKIDLVMCALNNGCRWNTTTCAYAALGGHLKLLKSLYKIGCPWDAKTCECASKGKSLECLKFAHENGCPWNANTYEEALNNFDGGICLRYARENGCPNYGSDTDDDYDNYNHHSHEFYIYDIDDYNDY